MKKEIIFGKIKKLNLIIKNSYADLSFINKKKIKVIFFGCFLMSISFFSSRFFLNDKLITENKVEDNEKNFYIFAYTFLLKLKDFILLLISTFLLHLKKHFNNV